MKNVLEEKLQVKLELRIRESTSLIKLTNRTNQIKIMKKKNKLNIKIREKIYIQDDLSNKDRGMQKKL